MPALDVLALAAHPDDVELCAGGTMCRLARDGYRTGIVDFTRGELGSRGTPEGRMEEAARAAEIMGLAVRDNLGLHDGRIENTPQNREALIRIVRRHRPHVVLLNAPECRHPDHCAAAALSTDALFYAGLRKIQTFEDPGSPSQTQGTPDPEQAGAEQEPWRPHHVLHYMQAVPFEPTLVVDVTDVWEERVAALQAFKSQFYNPDYEPGEDEPETFVSNEGFFRWVEARARVWGYQVGATYGEPFLYRHGPFGTTDLLRVLEGEKRYR